MELLADRDPEEARRLLDPVLEHMMEAVHHYEGTVNQVMGDGIMALFGAPLAHEDHAVRACYAALRMQERVARYADQIQRSHGVPLQIRIGLNSGDVVVRSIGSDLHMDYTAVGQTTHLAARMEQMAKPGSSLLTPPTLRLAEGYVRVRSLGPVPVRVSPIRWRCSSCWPRRRCGRGCKCRRPEGSRASSVARRRWISCGGRSGALGQVADKASRSSGSPVSARCAWCSRSSTRSGPMTGWS